MPNWLLQQIRTFKLSGQLLGQPFNQPRFFRRFRYWLRQQRGVVLVISYSAGLGIVAGLTGWLQGPEWMILDIFLNHRPEEPQDERILVVTLDEHDITRVGQWPIPDGVMAAAIRQIRAAQPRAIGLDVYRDLPIEPGHAELEEVFRTTPNLIGVEKAVDFQVKAPPALEALGQVGLADLVHDLDGKIRRGLLSVQLSEHPLKLCLPTQVALLYLAADGIEPQSLGVNQEEYALGRAIITRLRPNDGAYVGIDTGGYQILLNYRNAPQGFETVTFSDLLDGRVSPELMRDRVVFIGSIAPSLNDFFDTPIQQRLPGVMIHAHITSQVISAALDGRPFIRTVSDRLEWLCVLGWAVISTQISLILLTANPFGLPVSQYWNFMGTGLLAAGITGTHYLLFLNSLWLPVFPALIASSTAILTSNSYYNRKLQKLAWTDGLTQLANRPCFDQFLKQRLRQPTTLALILGDIDFFKLYNDTYGHQEGDRCLKKVAQVLQRSVRKMDLAARYGGEEFALVLPGCSADIAMQIGERILVQVRDANLPHEASKVSDRVTMSLGIAVKEADVDISPAVLIKVADAALYTAKQSGRNRVELAKYVS
ncbi:MAG: CHASE2 domain-containing protein [Synechococcales bacterium]|nr:CHASE2 domain-containing protein [Synechococcales bacterium]